MSNNTILDDQEAPQASAYDRGYGDGQRWDVLLGFIICLLLFGGSFLLKYL